MIGGLQHYWRKDSYDTLANVADLFERGPHAALFTSYIDYLKLRSRGLRKEALAAADRFVRQHCTDPFEIRQRICWHLIEQTETYWDGWPQIDITLFPGNIGAKLLAPMFKEWRIREPRNVNAWLYRLEWGFDLEVDAGKAFLMEPHNPRCQYAELHWTIKDLDYSLHEFGSCGRVLTTPDGFADLVRDLTAVTRMMGDNFNPLVEPYLSWHQELCELYSIPGNAAIDLRPVVIFRTYPVSEDFPYSQTRFWFKELPSFLVR